MAKLDRGFQGTILQVFTIRRIWVTHMKTTVELSDELLERTRKLALREGKTLKALIEEGLQRTLQARTATARTKAFSIEPFAGNGLSAEFSDASWQQIRDEIHALPITSKP